MSSGAIAVGHRGGVPLPSPVLFLSLLLSAVKFQLLFRVPLFAGARFPFQLLLLPLQLQCLLRSSVNSEKEALGDAIAAVFELAGAKVELTGSYDGWNPDMDSPILKAMTASYEALYGKKPAVTAIHAGLECGIIGSKCPKMDMISFGPTICYPHSPDEKVEIASVGKFYDFLVDTLRNVPEK